MKSDSEDLPTEGLHDAIPGATRPAPSPAKPGVSSMGVAEEAGKTISSVADAMKANPSCLAAILLAAMFAVLTYWSLTAERKEMHQRQLALIERCQFLAPRERAAPFDLGRILGKELIK